MIPNRWMGFPAAAALAMGMAACGNGGENEKDPRLRYEPEAPLDPDNYVYFEEPGLMHGVRTPGRGGGYFDLAYEGGLPQLPEGSGTPPNSGFRIALPRIVLEPFQEVELCQAWPIPPGLANRFVYSATMHSTGMVHHANMFAVPWPADEPRNPYPNCTNPDEAGGASFGGAFDAIARNDLGSFHFPQVLFANSTQVIGSEWYSQPEGYAYRIGDGAEILVDVHLLNTSGEPRVVETAWDFYTMPEERLEHETTAFTWFWVELDIPARSRKTYTTNCEIYGDENTEAISFMPHVHQWTPGFTVELLDAAERVTNTPYERWDIQTSDSWIETYDPPLGMADTRQIQFSCHFDNPFDHDMEMGVGENEMCFLFGYVSPPEALSAGLIWREGWDCISIPFGRPELMAEVDILDFIDKTPPDIVRDILGVDD